MSFLSSLRGAFDWVPKPIAREFWWFVLVFCVSGFFIGATGGSPRMGRIGGTMVTVGTEEGLLDALGYWAYPVIFGGIYVVVIALRLLIPRIRGTSVDQIAREIREKRRRERSKR